GPLCSFDDPQNLHLFSTLHRNKGKMRIEDHHHEVYRQAQTAFSGEGNRLERTETVSKVPTNSDSATPSTSSSSSSADPVLSRAKALSAALSFLNFDQSQPGTRIQIRLADGSR